jgi:hypothetical protein
MGTFPSRRDEFLNWCAAHDPVWTANATLIGMTGAQATAFNKAVDDLQAAILAQEQAKQAAKSATMTTEEREGELRRLATENVQRIRTFAQSTGNPSVYTLAQVPPVAPPTPVGPPGTPTDFTVALDPQGAITVRFKCVNPPNAGGTTYLVRRKLPAQAGFAFFTATGKKNFTDATLPSAIAQAEYVVQALRGDVAGTPSSTLIVRFGAGGDGAFTIASASVEDGGEVKLAA